MHDTNCPYCNAEVEINHDDGYGYEEDKVYEQECSKCDHVFHFHTTICFYYETEKAPCKNGEPHDWKQMHGAPSGWFTNQERCSYCDEERRKNPKLKYDNNSDKWE